METMSSSSCRFLSFANPPPQSPYFVHPSANHFMWQFKRDQGASFVARRTKSQVFRALVNSNVPTGRSGLIKEVIMVDPLEAKRLAAKQMQEIQAREKFKRRQQIEAINGAWAMIGLTAGLVIEGQTGKSILAQGATCMYISCSKPYDASHEPEIANTLELGDQGSQVRS